MKLHHSMVNIPGEMTRERKDSADFLFVIRDAMLSHASPRWCYFFLLFSKNTFETFSVYFLPLLQLIVSTCICEIKFLNGISMPYLLLSISRP